MVFDSHATGSISKFRVNFTVAALWKSPSEKAHDAAEPLKVSDPQMVKNPRCIEIYWDNLDQMGSNWSTICSENWTTWTRFEGRLPIFLLLDDSGHFLVSWEGAWKLGGVNQKMTLFICFHVCQSQEMVPTTIWGMVIIQTYKPILSMPVIGWMAMNHLPCFDKGECLYFSNVRIKLGGANCSIIYNYNRFVFGTFLMGKFRLAR